VVVRRRNISLLLAGETCPHFAPLTVIIGVLCVILIYVERCDNCGRIVWIESLPFGPLWIGNKCKYTESEESD